MEKRSVTLWVKLVQRVFRRFQNAQGPKIEDPLPPQRCCANAVLLRGMASAPDDQTFQELESRLPELGVKVTRFSYKGIQFPDYSPDDTIADMRRLVQSLDHYIRLADSDLPLYLFGHSMGGLIVANWICRSDAPPDHAPLLERIGAVFLFASPLFPPSPFILIPEGLPSEFAGLAYTLAPYPYDITSILERMPRIVVLLCESGKDPIAPTQYASLKGRDGSSPLLELEIPGANHLDICNQPMSVRAVVDFIEKYKTIR